MSRREPRLQTDGFQVGLVRNPYNTGIISDDDLYLMLLDECLGAQRWIEAQAGQLFSSHRAFLTLVIMGGGVPRHIPATEAVLGVVMVGALANRGHSLEQAWDKASSHWDLGQPNGEGLYLGPQSMRDGACNWGLSFELDGFIAGAEGLSQFPARHVGRMVVSGLAMRVVHAHHQWNAMLANRDLSQGRRPWLTHDGTYQGQRDSVRYLPTVRGAIPPLAE